MNVASKIIQIEKLKSEIDGISVYDTEIKKKIDYKFRLDWNYYSNKMEGGTLTRSETRSVMVGNIEVDGKPLKDIVEMKNHDVAILDILKIGKGLQQISEKRIKELHKAIMFEDDVEKRNWIGNWKEIPNEIINYKKEKVPFTPPAEVPDRLHKVLDTTKANLEKYFRGYESKHPIKIATDFHIDFLTIHPFYDGNGRICRILTNLILISCGFPPIIIKIDQKESYYRYLADIQCYGGDRDLLLSFFCNRLMDSQLLVLKAIQGENIEEDDDLDKRIALLDTQINTLDSDNELQIEFDKDVFFKLFDTWFSKLFIETITVSEKFNKYFLKTNLSITIGGLRNEIDSELLFPQEILANLRRQIVDLNMVKNIDLAVSYKAFKKNEVKPFDSMVRLQFVFSQFKYEIFSSVFNSKMKGSFPRKRCEKLYTQPLNETEIKNIATTLGNSILDQINYHLIKK